jgi:hypothetical protein
MIMKKRAGMSAEELRKGNFHFLFQAAYKIGTDSSFEEMLRRTELNRERERYDGLQEFSPPLGYIFADRFDAHEIMTMIQTDPGILPRFMRMVHEDSRRNPMKYFKEDDLSLVEVPFDNYYGKHAIILNITGYALGKPPFNEIPNPLELPSGTGLERLSKLGYKSLK